ncbi:hypothetical protein WJX84_005635 [Apatococcus fuscideae]|uniref:Nucleotide-diphospho-sugar transferase n=1 Tax=Apatococcus fuscideae TaxID=2026836 RepID=A0AAW1TAS8_9CHLO
MLCFKLLILTALSVLPTGHCWLYKPAAAWQEWFLPVEGDEDGTAARPAPQQLVDPEGALLTILLPIMPTQLELGYALNQLRTFSRLFNLQSIHEVLVVTPPEHVEEISRFYHHTVPTELPSIHPGLFRVVHDGQCVPEMDPGSTRYQPPEQRFTRGWVKQQLVKLACASIIQTPFYQILDADIFAVHPFSARDLFQEGPCEASSAVCDTATATSFRSKNDCYRMEGEWHASWWLSSADVLQLDLPLNEAWVPSSEPTCVPGVTPQTLSTHIARQLGAFLTTRFRVSSWTGYLLDASWHKDERQVRLGAADYVPAWTEYTLYFLFAYHSGLHDLYHTPGGVLQWNAIWDQEKFEAWDACADSFQWDYGYLSLVQSRMQIDPDLIWAKIQACWDVMDAAPAADVNWLSKKPSISISMQLPAVRMAAQMRSPHYLLHRLRWCIRMLCTLVFLEGSSSRQE